ncbi:MAG: CoA-binding protein [archaeon]
MKSIAIIGASNHREKFSNKCVRAYTKLGWKVFPVNPKEAEIEGIKCYASIKNVPQKTDLVSIYIPSQVTMGIIPELKGAKVAEVVLNPGAESDELIAELKKNGIKPLMICSIKMQGLSPDDF